jgi:CheY-like chemotaxis protein
MLIVAPASSLVGLVAALCVNAPLLYHHVRDQEAILDALKAPPAGAEEDKRVMCREVRTATRGRQDVPDNADRSADPPRSLEVEIDLTRAAKPFRDACFLVVDDDPAIVKLVGRVLRMSGAVDVHEITDAALVVPACLAQRPDVLLLDLNLGHLDGRHVLEQVRAAAPDDLAVIVLSGETSVDVRDGVLAAGAQDYIVKPFDLTELLQRLRALLAARATKPVSN